MFSYGEVVERFMAPVLKTGRANNPRGFESLPLRHPLLLNESLNKKGWRQTEGLPYSDIIFLSKPLFYGGTILPRRSREDAFSVWRRIDFLARRRISKASAITRMVHCDVYSRHCFDHLCDGDG